MEVIILVEEDIEYLKNNLPFWDKLNHLEKKEIINNTENVKVLKKESVYSGKNNCTGIALIKKGLLRAYLLSESGKELTLYKLYDNEFCVLSSSCFIKNLTFDVHINSYEDSELLLIKPEHFSKLIEKNMHIENFVYKTIVERFSDVMWTVEQNLFLTLEKRVSNYLLDEISKRSSNVLELTHYEIANNIGSAREAVSRVLKTFSIKGIIKLKRNKIEILDKSALMTI